MKVTRKIGLDYGHTLPNHYSYCSQLHGHRARVEATVEGQVLDEDARSSEGMVYDFGFLKEVMMEEVHDELDHAFALYEDGDKDTREFITERNDRVLFLPTPPTAEALAKWAYEQIQSEIPDRIDMVRVRWYETPNNWADYEGE